MMKNIVFIVLVLGGFFNKGFAQTINIELSKFAGDQYIYALELGEKRDTIAKGELDGNGKTILVLPAAYKGFTGITHFSIVGKGGFDFIVNKENFSISCLETQPNFENTIFKGSPENEYLRSRFPKGKQIQQKVKMILYGFTIYKKEDALFAALEKEKINLNQQLVSLKKSTAESKLYAARIVEIYDVLTGVGSSVDLPNDQNAKEINLFIKEKLDMQELYNSGYWGPLIENWVAMNTNLIKDDAVLLADSKQIAARIKSNTIYTAFAEKLIKVFTQNGKDNLVNEFTDYVAKSGRIVNPDKKLQNAINGPKIGGVPPALIVGKNKRVITKKTLLFFYESGCNNCENEIHQLLGNYEVLKDKGYEIISVAADMTADAGDGHGHTFPWKEQLCDFKGFAGPNFQTYSVIGTPTFFVIDDKGKIEGRYARLVDTGILSNNFTFTKEK